MWRGRHVETPYGWGICTSEGDPLLVTLDSRERCQVAPSEVLRSSFGALGSCLMTSEGPGVLMRYRRQEELHEVQLSSGQRSLLKASELQKVLVALPGLKVVTTRGPGTCQEVEEERVLVAFQDGSAMAGSVILLERAVALHHQAKANLVICAITHVTSFIGRIRHIAFLFLRHRRCVLI